ncbi:hypothetical protein BCR44DRAFT_1479098 [Catenaria anguillulae PL171]|uniref:Calcium-transporting ATPase n=1 Tax=Catenaria anguillulae PL171 TaxID=765915 RepID=A0A1Y2HZS1_9FUNG|nr:hypothetical protein BCR44DRAFT_1479098 [Catenaria anguillulae PL171]
MRSSRRRRSRASASPQNPSSMPIHLTDNRDTDLLAKLGGAEGVAKYLRTDLERGLATDEQGPRGDCFQGSSPRLRHQLFATTATTVVPGLCVEQLGDRMLQILLIAAVVSIGVGIFMAYSKIGDPTEWIEGVAILCTVAFVILVNATNDYKKALQFRFLSSQRGRPAQTTIPVMHLQVGDIVHLATGDVVPADGIFLSGHQCKTDESSVTGETDAVSKKMTGDRFLISGSKVIEGICTYVVTAVGPHSLAGRSLMAMRTTEAELTPLQVKLTDLANNIAKYGIGAAAFIVIVSIIKFFIIFAPSGFTLDQDGNPATIFITGVTVIVVAVPEGLPMAVTLALAYATIRMLKDQNLVRVLSACETMGGATTICSDKTGTLTQNKMTVVQGTFFNGAVVFDTQEQLRPRLMAPEISADARLVLTQSININSTATRTECALLEFTSLLATTFNLDRQAAVQVGVIPFSSDRKRMSTVVAKDAPIHAPARLFTKGASELVLASCDFMVDEHGKVVPMTADRRAYFEGQILAMPPTLCVPLLDMSGLIWLGVAGIEDPLRPEVPPAVERCQRAGIIVRMVTGDNAVTARNIAKRCGILGAQFHAPQVACACPSSPLDKRILVNKLKEMGQTVAVTGDGTNDAPALKAADVGFAMGIAGTEVAKEASDIILMDDNFASLAKAVMWGRSVYDAVRKFLQFQLSVNVTAVVLAMITATADSKSRSIISAVQLLWVNLIMDTMAALALATDPPTEDLLNRKPHKKSDPLISYNMWKMILLQSLYQIIGCTAADPKLDDNWLKTAQYTARSDYYQWHLSAIVFNTFVWMTVFNIFNGRTLYQELNVFHRMFKNNFFPTILVIIVVLQILIIQFGSAAFGVIPLTGPEWGVSVAMGFVALPLGVLIKLLPDFGREWFETKFYDRSEEQARVVEAWQDAIRRTQLQNKVVTAFRMYKRDAPGIVSMQVNREH